VSLDDDVFSLLHYRAGAIRPLDLPLLTWARFGSAGEICLMLLMGISHGRAGRQAVRRSLLAVAATYVLVEFVGRLSGRSRPAAAHPSARPLLPHSTDRTFPSRHVASAVALGAVARPVAPRLALAMWVGALALGLGRIRAGLHYPSDVLGGVLLGWLVGRLFR
jgi:undecaprenyl-diphosphatase